MRVAIDIDGTITAMPEFFNWLIDRLLIEGHEVHILTGANWPQFEKWQYAEAPSTRVQQLAKYGLDKWTRLVEVRGDGHNGPGFDGRNVAWGKATYCRDNKIDLIFEDNIHYIKAIREVSPGTRAWLIH